MFWDTGIKNTPCPVSHQHLKKTILPADTEDIVITLHSALGRLELCDNAIHGLELHIQ